MSEIVRSDVVTLDDFGSDVEGLVSVDDQPGRRAGPVASCVDFHKTQLEAAVDSLRDDMVSSIDPSCPYQFKCEVVHQIHLLDQARHDGDAASLFRALEAVAERYA